VSLQSLIFGLAKRLTTLRQLGFSDVDYSSGNFSKQMLTSHHFANGHVPHYRQFSTSSKHKEPKPRSMRRNGSQVFHVKTKLNLNSGTSKEKSTAVHREEALDFSPRCSYLPPVWYPLGQWQLHPTNHCHHRSLIACSGVSP
jgi:hypothetical protein